MTTYTLSGVDSTTYLIKSGASEIPVNISKDPLFLPMNAWDCCKDAIETTTKITNPALLDGAIAALFGGANWLAGWKHLLNTNFKEYMTSMNYQEEEIVFERNKITVERLVDPIYYFNESGLGGKRVAFDKHIEVDTAAQHIDEGPGNGDPQFKFPKNEDILIFDALFFGFFGFPQLIQNWTATSDDTKLGFKYNITFNDTVIRNPDILKVSNPTKNQIINDATSLTAEVIQPVLFKECGDCMQTATYMAFIKIMENWQNLSTANSPINMPQDIFDLILYKCGGDIATIKKFIYYLTIMLTCDKTVHYRNIKLGLPSCLTGSNTEAPYENSTKTGRIFLPNTDPIEKLKSLLNMEFRLLEKNNLAIAKRLLFANLNTELTYYKLARGGTRETPITSTIPEIHLITDFISALTTRAQDKNSELLVAINGMDVTNADDIEAIRNRINIEFKDFLCPPFVIPRAPIVDITDPMGGPLNRKGCIICKPLEDVSLDKTSLNKLLTDVLQKIRVDLTGGMMTGDDDDDRQPDPSTTKALIKSGDTMEGMDEAPGKPASILDDYSSNEKFLIYWISTLLPQSDKINMLYYEEIYFVYSQCIFALEKFKNINYTHGGVTYNCSDDEYAFFRLHRAIEYTFLCIYGRTIPPQNWDSFERFMANDVIPYINSNTDPLHSENIIDTNINVDILTQFGECFKYTEIYDNLLIRSEDGDGGGDGSKDDSQFCAGKFSVLSGRRIELNGIVLKSGYCMGHGDLLKWYNTKYGIDIADIAQMHDGYFTNPFTNKPFPSTVISALRITADPPKTVGTRQKDPSLFGLPAHPYKPYGPDMVRGGQKSTKITKHAKKTKKKRNKKKHTKKMKFRKAPKSKTHRKTKRKGK